jgi:hypothetical protein
VPIVRAGEWRATRHRAGDMAMSSWFDALFRLRGGGVQIEHLASPSAHLEKPGPGFANMAMWLVRPSTVSCNRCERLGGVLIADVTVIRGILGHGS